MNAENPNRPDVFTSLFIDGIANTSARVGNVAGLATPLALLRVMTWELVTVSGMAQNAAERLLKLRASEEPIDFPVWESLQVLLTCTVTAANFVWPTATVRRKRPKSAARGRDLGKLLHVDEGQFAQTRIIRNALSHLDERLEDHFAGDNAFIYSRQVWEAGEPQSGHVLGWDCYSKQLYSFDTTVDGRALKREIDLLAKRSWEAWTYTRWVE